MVTEEHLEEGRLYPPLCDIHNVSTRLATRIVEYVYEMGIAGTYPEPKDKLACVRKYQYNATYDTCVPHIYPWPGMSSGLWELPLSK